MLKPDKHVTNDMRQRSVHPIIRSLRAERKRLKLSRRELVAKIGYDQSQLYQWEVGKVWPTVHKVADWAEGLGLELAVKRKDG